MKEIPLTQGKTALVDDKNYDKLMQYKWFAYQYFYTFYAMRTIILNGHKTSISMHREILGLHHGDKMIGDHKDRNGLHNWGNNLRIVSPSNSNFNQKRRKDNTSGYRGVSYSQRENRYRAYININGHFKSLGYFDDPEEAALFYDQTALQIAGDIATLNFPLKMVSP